MILNYAYPHCITNKRIYSPFKTTSAGFALIPMTGLLDARNRNLFPLATVEAQIVENKSPRSRLVTDISTPCTTLSRESPVALHRIELVMIPYLKSTKIAWLELETFPKSPVALTEQFNSVLGRFVGRMEYGEDDRTVGNVDSLTVGCKVDQTVGPVDEVPEGISVGLTCGRDVALEVGLIDFTLG
jgi:hypothetical protein